MLPGFIWLGKASAAVTKHSSKSQKQKIKISKKPLKNNESVFSLIQSLQPVGSWAAVLHAVTQESKFLWLCALPSEHAATTLTKRKEKVGSLYQRDFAAYSLTVQCVPFSYRPLCRTSHSGRWGSGFLHELHMRGVDQWTQVTSTKTALVKSIYLLTSRQKVNKP